MHIYTDSQIAIAWIKKSKIEGRTQTSELTSNTTKYINEEKKSSTEERNINWAPTDLNNGDGITRRAYVDGLLNKLVAWF